MTTFANQTKNSASWANATKTATTFANQAKSVLNSKLLMETLDALLMESGDALLLETAAEGTSWNNQSKN